MLQLSPGMIPSVACLLPCVYKPRRGTTSDVAGTFSITPSKKTVIASNTVIANDT